MRAPSAPTTQLVLLLLLLLLLNAAVRGAVVDPEEAVGNCGTRAEVKALIINTLCKEPREVRKILTDKMWRCKSGSLDATTLQSEVVAIARQDENRGAECQPLPTVAVAPAGGGGGGGGFGGGGGVGAGAGAGTRGMMDPTDTPCTRDSIDRIYMQILCREPSSKEAFGRNWQCKNGKLGDRKLMNSECCLSSLFFFYTARRARRNSLPYPLTHPPANPRPTNTNNGTLARAKTSADALRADRNEEVDRERDRV